MNIFNYISVYLLLMLHACFMWFEIKFLAFLEEPECYSDMDKIDILWHGDYCVLPYSLVDVLKCL